MIAISIGTYHYLSKWREAHPDKETACYISGPTAVLVINDDTPPKEFKEAKTYDVLSSAGPLQGAFAAFQYLSITEEGQPLFEQRHRELHKKVQPSSGLHGIHVLVPRKGHQYVVMSVWDKETSYQYHSVPLVDEHFLQKGPHSLFEPSFTKVYHEPVEDREESDDV
ncbi:hypothetical protein G4V62_07685 [Bacillaceae bacterium SIJ1]|uniref:antibiotic biosynthesis monooxygenase n=1 Tax=Litoribacterium kuwaitense TaxID=1398745 RepID=UPI0013ED7913|nr:antibiotic biosynthesis monooxygenase [Litoribacterium kuwaitense]NGP44846.1 hypothetical protein [Litoribacterium kuwaitense]